MARTIKADAGGFHLCVRAGCNFSPNRRTLKETRCKLERLAQFSIHQAQSHLAQLLEQVEKGEEVIIARHGKPIARLVSFQPEQPQSILGIGLGDPNYRSGLSDEQAFSPMNAEDAAAFYNGSRL